MTKGGLEPWPDFKGMDLLSSRAHGEENRYDKLVCDRKSGAAERRERLGGHGAARCGGASISRRYMAHLLRHIVSL